MFEFFVGGAAEICGSSTEFQGGFVLGTVSEFGIRAFAKPNGTDNIHIESEDFGNFDIEIGDTEPRADEAEIFSALVRGIMNGFIESGNIFGGFDAKISSEIPAESGISAAATFEVLIGKIISTLFFENSVPALRLAQFGQLAESDYYGRPCGLSKQLISAVGKTALLDFSDSEIPRFCELDFDFSKSGLALALIKSSGEPSDSFEKEMDIQKDLALVSWNMGHNFLSEADEAEFIAQFPILRQKCGEKAVLRGLRFFEESRRAQEMAEALETCDFSGFLALCKKSAESSEEKPAALSFIQNLLGESGAAIVFSKNVLAFVFEENLAEFVEKAEKQGLGVMFLL